MINWLSDFEWSRCPSGYGVTDRWSLNPGEEEKIDNVEVIAPKSQEKVAYRPFAKVEGRDLYLLFAHITTTNGLLGFMEKYGLLSTNSWQWGDSVRGALEEAKFFRDLISKGRSPKNVAAIFNSKLRTAEIASNKKAGMDAPTQIDPRNLYVWIGSVDVVAHPSRGIHFRFKPDSLMDALWWQITSKLSGDCSFATCRSCGLLFERGVGAGRRADAEFCSDEHRIHFNSFKRSKRE